MHLVVGEPIVNVSHVRLEEFESDRSERRSKVFNWKALY